MIEVERKAFERALSLASIAVERRSTIPILSQVKATANGSLVIESTDLDIFARAEVPSTGDVGEFCIPDPRAVTAMVSAAGGKTVQLEPEKGKLSIKAGPLGISVAALYADDHPASKYQVEEQFSATLTAETLKQIGRLRSAICMEETRYYLNGICVWKLDSGLYRFAATNGHVLMTLDLPLDAAGELPQSIIPRQFLNHAFEHFGASSDIHLGYGTAAAKGKGKLWLSAQLGEAKFLLLTKLIDGTYPEVEKVVPADIPHTARLSRSALAQAMNALRPLSTDKFRLIKFSFAADSVTVECTNNDLGTGRITMPVEHDLPAHFVIGFRDNYLLDICGNLRGDIVQIGLSDPAAPTMFTDPADPAFRAIIMPMRVN